MSNCVSYGCSEYVSFDGEKCIYCISDEYKYRIDKLEKQNQVLMEAVEFYGSSKNWNCQMDNVLNKPIAYIPRIDTDNDGNSIWGGKKAREALAAVKEIEGETK